jgi:hypothetical protein
LPALDNGAQRASGRPIPVRSPAAKTTPTRNGLAWRFCGRCGAEMRWYHAGDGYDRDTGEFGPNFAWRCPNWQPGERSRTHDISNTTVRDLRGEVLSQ